MLQTTTDLFTHMTITLFVSKMREAFKSHSTVPTLRDERDRIPVCWCFPAGRTGAFPTIRGNTEATFQDISQECKVWDEIGQGRRTQFLYT